MSDWIDGLARAAAARQSRLSRRQALKLGAASAALVAFGARLAPRAYAEGDGDCGCPSCGGPANAYCLAPDSLIGYQQCAGGGGAPGSFYCPTGQDCCSSELPSAPCCVPGYQCCKGTTCCEPGLTCCISESAGADGLYSASCCPPGSPCNPDGTCGTVAPLVAKLKVSGPVLRGGVVTLDASASTPPGAITNYTYHFAPGPDCPKGLTLDATQKNTGASPVTQIKLVCSLDVTVTVTDGAGRQASSAVTRARVRARHLKAIPFKQTAQDAVTLPFTQGEALAFGLNRSAQVWDSSGHDPDAADHWLDPGVDPKGIKDSVETEQVDDEFGPFDQFWYVVGHKLRIERVIVLNKKLLRGGSVYDSNRRHRGALTALVNATRAHERVHGQLAHAALNQDGSRWLRELEQSIAADRPGLLDATNEIIRDAETTLKEASAESKVHGRMRGLYGNQRVSIVVPTAGADAVHRFRLAELGDL